VASGHVEEIVLPGPNACRAALESEGSRPSRLLIREGETGPRLRELAELARKRRLPTERVSRETLDRLSPHTPHQGAVLILREWTYADESVLRPSPGEKSFILILDHLQDVGNLGAILRSAYLCGVTGVAIPKARAAGITPGVVRASAGAAIHLPVCRVPNVAAAIRDLKERGVWVFGLDAEGASILETDLSGPLALVVGGEDQGLSRLAREECDLVVSIPMRRGRVGSYNASVAAAIALWEISRREGKEGGGPEAHPAGGGGKGAR
jgi:23S rRNA (guanosine2251-2'-O)-methyltransferase